MIEHVIEIVHHKELDPEEGDLIQCSEHCHAPAECKWATLDYCPTEDCPGPGRYKLVRIDGDDRDGILGPK